MTHKAGYVTIIGFHNTGKSTLLNALAAEKLAIISPKAQTTRHRIKAFVNGENYQIIFSDTPGILIPKYKLQQAMLKSIRESLEDADVILLITEPVQIINQELLPEQIRGGKIPVIILINKIDISTQKKVEEAYELWNKLIPFATIMPVSALLRINLKNLLDKIIDLLPESPPYFPKDELTEHQERFFVSEMIREQILLQFHEEIPYSCEVAIESFKEMPELIHITAVIFVMRESQKAILLGHHGKAIRKLGSAARKEIESFLRRHIFLQLRVKVEPEWRENERSLRRFGYTLSPPEEV